MKFYKYVIFVNFYSSSKSCRDGEGSLFEINDVLKIKKNCDLPDTRYKFSNNHLFFFLIFILDYYVLLHCFF
jgi:hypothetical protein